MHPLGEEPAAESPSEAVGRGDTNVLRLRDLLLGQISPTARQYLEKKFDKLNFVGGFEDKLVEYCLEMDPVAILIELLSNPDLIALCEEYDSEKSLPGDLHLKDKQELCCLLLDLLGFKRVESPNGISQILEDSKQLNVKVSTADNCTLIRGCVLEAGCKAEGVLQDLIRFYGTLLLPQPFEGFLQKQKWNNSGKPLQLLTFGQLFGVLEHFEHAIERPPDLKCRLHKEDPAELPQRFGELFPGQTFLAPREANTAP